MYTKIIRLTQYDDLRPEIGEAFHLYNNTGQCHRCSHAIIFALILPPALPCHHLSFINTATFISTATGAPMSSSLHNTHQCHRCFRSGMWLLAASKTDQSVAGALQTNQWSLIKKLVAGCIKNRKAGCWCIKNKPVVVK